MGGRCTGFLVVVFVALGLPAVSDGGKPKAISSKKSQTRAAVLVCKFAKNPTLQVVTGTGSATMNALVSNEIDASLKLGQDGALTYNSKVCKAKAPLIPA